MSLYQYTSTFSPDRIRLRAAMHALSKSVRNFTLIMTIVAVSLSSEQTVAQQNVVLPEKECQLKYVYLYSFGLLTAWPETAVGDADAPFVIGVFGEKPFGELLDRLAETKQIRGRPILIRRLKHLDDYKPCHILYITATVKEKARKALLAKTKQAPVLIVGESHKFEQTGAVINFYFSGQNLRFYLNLDEADRRHLSISARLIRLATVVRNRPLQQETGGKVVVGQ